MASTIGDNIKLTIFGESHSQAIGMTLDGVPAGEEINMDELMKFMGRRAPGRDKYSTQRKESDIPEFISGIMDKTTTGTPITCIIRNHDTRSEDYDDMNLAPRPGHADYTAHIKYFGNEDHRGGGHFSGRLTAPICAAGGILLQILERHGVTCEAKATELAGVRFGRIISDNSKTAKIAIDKEKEKTALESVETVRRSGDSVGGIVTGVISGLPAGLGEPMFDGVENLIAKAIFGIPAVKGVEFGRGFAAARDKGSENNDPFILDDNGDIVTEKNDHGGSLGGITSGMPVTVSVAFKPTPSIAIEQRTVTYEGEVTSIAVKGRHDPCVARRGAPVVEAILAICAYDLAYTELIK